MNKKMFYSIFFGIALILIISVVSYNFFNVNPKSKINCYYDRDIAIKKAQFDFINAYYGYPYDKRIVDWEYAVKFYHCDNPIGGGSAGGR